MCCNKYQPFFQRNINQPSYQAGVQRTNEKDKFSERQHEIMKKYKIRETDFQKINEKYNGNLF